MVAKQNQGFVKMPHSVIVICGDKIAKQQNFHSLISTKTV